MGLKFSIPYCVVYVATCSLLRTHCVISLNALISTNFSAASTFLLAFTAQPHRQYDELTSKHIDSLRQLTKQIQDARIARDNDAIKTSLEVGQERFAAFNRITCLVGASRAKLFAASGQRLDFFIFRAKLKVHKKKIETHRLMIERRLLIEVHPTRSTYINA